MMRLSPLQELHSGLHQSNAVLPLSFLQGRPCRSAWCLCMCPCSPTGKAGPSMAQTAQTLRHCWQPRNPPKTSIVFLKYVQIDEGKSLCKAAQLSL